MFKLLNICYGIKNQLLLDSICCSFRQGQITGILGANGAGKSTLFKIISQEYSPHSGEILLDDIALKDYHTQVIALQRAVVTQHETVNSDINVFEYVMLGRLAHSLTGYRKLDFLSAANAMQAVEVLRFKNRKYLSLSGGERGRVQLARALAQLDNGDGYSGYLLLDEFTANMDIYYQQIILELLSGLCQKYQLGILIIEHDLNLASRFFDNCLLLKNGRLIACGSAADVLNSRNIKSAFNVQANTILIENKLIVYY